MMHSLKLIAPRLKRIRKGLNLLGLLFLASPSWGKLNPTYPSAATTQIRVDSYNDSFKTIAQSSWTIQVSTWEVLAATYTWISSTPTLNGWTAEFTSFTFHVDGSTTSNWDVEPTTWSVSDFVHLIQAESRNRDINKILDDDFEEYMVWPSTTSCPPDWQGWMLRYVNNNPVPVPCVYGN